jgi:nucleoid-associated protein YgaU
MHPNLKVALAAMVLFVGIAAAYMFRKPAPVREASPSSPDPFQTASPQAPLAASHLLGRIDPVSPPSAPHESLQPRTDDPERRADVPRQDASDPENAMPSAPPWVDEQDRGAIAARMTSLATSPAPPRPETPNRPRAARKIHRVVDGDTLPKLAERYLGSADRFSEIYEANRDLLQSPDVLPIGLSLKIPDPGDPREHALGFSPGPMVDIPSEQLQAARGRTGASLAGETRTYQVRSLDTLAEISRQVYGDPSRFGEILEANREKLTRPEDLREGMVLVIP